MKLTAVTESRKSEAPENGDQITVKLARFVDRKVSREISRDFFWLKLFNRFKGIKQS